MDKDRLVHSYSVAKKMMEIAKDMNLNEEEIKSCFLIGINHDVGYDKRLEDIKSRYGEESYVYKSCLKLINKIK